MAPSFIRSRQMTAMHPSYHMSIYIFKALCIKFQVLID